ncbi:MAG: hypothetical protein KJ709_05020 [Nanoarchaeota archaeon]|nr:hypothetical protein [Nanoarchaeota archaeon]
MAKEKPEIITSVEDRLWTNIQQSSPPLKAIIREALHDGHQWEDYESLDLWTEITKNTSTEQYDIWIQPRMIHKEKASFGIKLWRTDLDDETKREVCDKIWNGVDKQDISMIAQYVAEQYKSGKRHMDREARSAMEKFYPKIVSGKVALEIVLGTAQYRVFNPNT